MSTSDIPHSGHRLPLRDTPPPSSSYGGTVKGTAGKIAKTERTEKKKKRVSLLAKPISDMKAAPRHAALGRIQIEYDARTDIRHKNWKLCAEASVDLTKLPAHKWNQQIVFSHLLCWHQRQLPVFVLSEAIAFIFQLQGKVSVTCSPSLTFPPKINECSAPNKRMWTTLQYCSVIEWQCGGHLVCQVFWKREPIHFPLVEKIC